MAEEWLDRLEAESEIDGKMKAERAFAAAALLIFGKDVDFVAEHLEIPLETVKSWTEADDFSLDLYRKIFLEEDHGVSLREIQTMSDVIFNIRAKAERRAIEKEIERLIEKMLDGTLFP